MKKIIAKKGFTLVEVMVAFVIFAIMAAMISVLLNTTMTAKQNNLEVERDIEEQQKNYYLVDLDREFDDSVGSTGSISLGFKKADGSDISSAFSVDYQKESTVADGEDPMLYYEYFVGNVNYDSFIESQQNPSGGSGGLIDKLDSRIYTTSGVDQMNIKVTDKGGNRYHFQVMLSAPNMDSTYKVMAQIKMVFPSAILGCGYVTDAGSEVSSPPEAIRVNALSGNILRISRSSTATAGTSTDTTDISMFSNLGYQGFWVQLASPLATITDGGTTRVDLDKVFGTSADGGTSTWSGTSYAFTPYVDSEGNAHTNVLAGFPLSQPEPEGGETSEPE